MIRITKEFNLEMAHALYGYDGLCKNIHGHTYYLYVTIKGEPESNSSSPKLGMVMDFGDLKKIVKGLIIDKLDHALVLNGNSPHKDIKDLKHPGFEKVVLMNYQPTCENLLVDFAARLQSSLPANVKLYSLKLCETVTSSAEWYAEDN
jgi:6-pyruvoyltetrahydropterin/6-carboxytetrahydropterin synthase